MPAATERSKGRKGHKGRGAVYYELRYHNETTTKLYPDQIDILVRSTPAPSFTVYTNTIPILKYFPIPFRLFDHALDIP
jgi:hypothetical protein